MTEPIRVLIVDDHPMYRAGLSAALEPIPGIETVGEAGDGDLAVTLAADLHPDVVLMDLAMPGMSGVAATRTIVERCPDIAVIVLTMSHDTDSIWAAMRAGARGYLMKGSDQGDIARAIEAVHQGDVLFGPSVAERVLRLFQGSAAAPNPFPELTEREVEVLTFVAAGKTNNEIASRLYLSSKTIRNHVSNIFTKLQVATRSDAIRRARDAGLHSHND